LRAKGVLANNFQYHVVRPESIRTKPAECRLLESAGYRGSAAEMAAAFLLDFALASNRDGMVLLSMYEEKHLRSNLDRLAASPAPDAVLGLRDQLSRQP